MKMHKKTKNGKLVIGWEEWCALPSLKVPLIKAKIDTGAKTSSLHAYDITYFKKGQKSFVKFTIHPVQSDDSISIKATAEIIDYRSIMSSNGHNEKRYVIKTELVMADESWPIELTLSNRDPLRFRMLLGREALRNRVRIDPHESFNLGKYTNKLVKTLYNKVIKDN